MAALAWRHRKGDAIDAWVTATLEHIEPAIVYGDFPVDRDEVRAVRRGATGTGGSGGDGSGVNGGGFQDRSGLVQNWDPATTHTQVGVIPKAELEATPQHQRQPPVEMPA